MNQSPPPRPLLALDTSAPVVSVAVAAAGRVLAARRGAQRESSARLLRWIEEALLEAGVRAADLAGLVALAGPGSFTGLRVGLATALGLHQSLGIPATTLPTLQVLAAAAPPRRAALCVAPALPGEWFAQAWGTDWPPAERGEPRRVPTAGLAALLDEAAGPGGEPLLVGPPGVELGEASRLTGIAGFTAPELAPVAALLASMHPPEWNAGRLSSPLYLAPAPVTVAGAPKRVLPPAREGR